ncbi:hypothetical protein [Metapseudomonas otitidis]|uniref:hypothetical protein n=1 Tax=Metapseudomonas otitidis TaxID=319939 RepID=UPI002632FAFA|nr:hypothetical protein [Pseudomonas otitidis]
MATINPWKRFIGLLPGGSRVVARIVSIDPANGSSIVELRNGAHMLATGTAVEVGRNAFIRDGVITAEAPDLPQYDVEV